MHRAKAFLFVCTGIFLLALSYHLGATSATAQAGSSVVGVSTSPATSTFWWVMTPTGDIFMRSVNSGVLGPSTLVGNFWDAPTPTQPATLGEVKVRWR